MVSLKNWKTRLEFAKNILKKPEKFWKNILWTDETKIYLYQNDWKRRVWRRLFNSIVVVYRVSMSRYIWT